MRTLICHKCGKEFIPAPYHIYKDSEHWYCKWTCYNHRNDETKEGAAYEDNKDQSAERA